MASWHKAAAQEVDNYSEGWTVAAEPCARISDAHVAAACDGNAVEGKGLGTLDPEYAILGQGRNFSFLVGQHTKESSAGPPSIIRRESATLFCTEENRASLGRDQGDQK